MARPHRQSRNPRSTRGRKPQGKNHTNSPKTAETGENRNTSKCSGHRPKRPYTRTGLYTGHAIGHRKSRPLPRLTPNGTTRQRMCPVGHKNQQGQRTPIPRIPGTNNAPAQEIGRGYSIGNNTHSGRTRTDSNDFQQRHRQRNVLSHHSHSIQTPIARLPVGPRFHGVGIQNMRNQRHHILWETLASRNTRHTFPNTDQIKPSMPGGTHYHTRVPTKIRDKQQTLKHTP